MVVKHDNPNDWSKELSPNLKYKNVIGRFSDWVIGCQFAVINEVLFRIAMIRKWKCQKK